MRWECMWIECWSPWVLVHLWEKTNQLTFQDRLLKFSDFQSSRFLLLLNIFENMLVRYRGINNKGVPERPGTKWKVLEPFLILWNVSLPENVEKWTFLCHVRPNRANKCCAVFVRSVRSPWTPPDLPNFNMNYETNSFVKNKNFPIRFLPEMDQYQRRRPSTKGARRLWPRACLCEFWGSL